MKTSINKLSIYLVKAEYSDHKVILKNFDLLKSKKIENIGTFYYGDSFKSEPTWVKRFFGNQLVGEVDLYNATSKAILLIDVNKDDNKRIFALAFGYEWQILNKGIYEERFGLRTTLNVIDPVQLRKIEKKNMTIAPKYTSEQLTKAGIAADFGINIEQDLVRAITGCAKDPALFGKIITGKDSLSVSVKVDLTNIKDLLVSCYEGYLSDEYKEYFGWIDQVAEIKDPKLIKKLNDILVKNIKDRTPSMTWMSVPEIIDWENIVGFRYENTKTASIKEDIHLSDFIEFLANKNVPDWSVDFLKNKKIYCISALNDDVKYEWSVYSCLYSEVHDKINNKTYLLSDGRWYEIEQDFVREINNNFKSFSAISSDVRLPVSGNKNEPDYNEFVAKNNPDYFLIG